MRDGPMKYAILRREMFVKQITQAEIGKVLGKSSGYLTSRFCGDGCFTIDEGYKILDFLKVPHSEFTEYFPATGYLR